MKLKTGDEVKILQGKDKGKKGKIQSVLVKKNKVIVTGVNMYKKHAKRQGNSPASIVDLIKPLSVANVSLICSKCNLTTRIGFILKNGEKKRICKKCKKEI